LKRRSGIDIYEGNSYCCPYMERRDSHMTLINRIMNLLHERSHGRQLFPEDIGSSDNASAVLFLLGEHCDETTLRTEPCVVLTKRSMKVRQPGDLCFPGGRIAMMLDYLLSKFLTLPLFPLARWPYWEAWRDLRGENAKHLALLFATSLRESLEEMGLNPLGVRFLGPLPPENLRMFNRIIYPMVGWIARQRHFLLNWEVDRIVYIPIQSFLNPDHYARYRLSMAPRGADGGGEEETEEFPCFRHRIRDGEEVLWGVTYRIVMVFLELVYGFKAPELNTLPIIHGCLERRYFSRGR
jgi:8-oxo-dGTP pyrophosphatase MutT (NUDIX family)